MYKNLWDYILIGGFFYYIMIVYHFQFAKLGLTISGGEKFMIELIKFLKKKKIKNVLLTTDNGKENYLKEGLIEDKYLSYKIINSYGFEKKTHPFLSYVYRTPKACRAVKGLHIEEDDILLCHNEYIPNILPFYIASKRNKKARLFYFVHMICPDLFKGYEGHFTNKWRIPRLNLLHYKITQWIDRHIMQSRGTIITPNPYYKEFLLKKYPAKTIRIIKRFGGVDSKIISNNIKKKYDFVWVGRFHPQKGLFELVDILKRIVHKKKSAKLLIIGDGEEGIKERFFSMIEKSKLSDNVDYVGFKSGKEKYKLLSQAKVFLMTSYFESYGLVIIEALKCGLPVIAYDLPVYEIFKKGVIKVKILDNKQFSDLAWEIISNKETYNRCREESLKYSRVYSWENTGKEIYSYLKEKAKSDSGKSI